MVANGRAVRKDYAAALQWFHSAADGGNVDAIANIGVMYENGWGVPQDRAEAISHYVKAAGLGSEFAKQCLRNLGVAAGGSGSASASAGSAPSATGGTRSSGGSGYTPGSAGTGGAGPRGMRGTGRGRRGGGRRGGR
jgi:hypothetical protein